MKIIHISDLHLNSALNAFTGEKAKTRKDEILITFEKIVEYATNNQVLAIIIAGDMFDTSKVLSRTKNRVLHAISSNKDVKFFYLKGNHDQDSFISSLESVPENLYVFDDEWKYFDLGGVTVCGICINSVNSSSIYNSLSLNETDVNIAVMHGQVAGYVNSSEEGEIISIPRLRDKYIDYLALGHYHSYSQGEIDLRGKYVYSGCPDGRGFDETGKKGFVLLDIDGKKVNHTFVPFSSRELFELEYEIDQNVSWYDTQSKIANDCANLPSGSIAKVVINGVHDLDYDVDIESLQDKLSRILFYSKVVDKTQLKLTQDDYMLDKSVRGEFVRSVMESDLSDELKNKVVLLGLKALKGEIN